MAAGSDDEEICILRGVQQRGGRRTPDNLSGDVHAGAGDSLQGVSLETFSCMKGVVATRCPRPWTAQEDSARR